MNRGSSFQPSARLLELASQLRLLWATKPSNTLWDTACRLGLGNQEAENLVVDLTVDGMVRWVPCEQGLKAVFQ